MSVVETRYEHIVRNEKDVPIIAKANFKVIRLVTADLANNWDVSGLQEQYPFLTKGQIHSALAYYWDHKDEIDRQIHEELEFVEQMRQNYEPPAFIARLKAQGLNE